jgi:alkaline phosphatase D
MAGGQYFGEVEIDGKTAAMTVHLREINGASLWSTTLAPQRG